ncbi:hypothetical protein BCR34DRAFT_559596 [Clohesyomyces aquaticus]|uniref:Serine/threonine-protein kinase ppk6 n=1 Tax=Clohesyomyces aquaticus TaxID=1231657 RepID=A0A1Y1ZX88_9PLEO|nr:hypothetical protein BCR34DRAFT_559596 [Clohesyomyces aquaticus]
MSADLFAEFGTSPPPQQPKSSNPTQPVQSFGFLDDLTSSSQVTTTSAWAPAPPSAQAFPFQIPTNTATTAAADDTDDWGDFEGVDVQTVKLDPDPFFFPPSQTGLVSQTAPVIKAKKSADPNVLFDAEEEDDDEFGHFEGPGVLVDNGRGATVNAPPPPNYGVSVLATKVQSTVPSRVTGLEEVMQDVRVSTPNAPPPNYNVSVPSTKRQNPVEGFGSMPKPRQTSPAPETPPEEQEEEAWDDFDEWEASIPTTTHPKPSTPSTTNPSTIPTTDVLQSSISSSVFDEPQPGEQPPTNVPPPGVLLSLFPTIFADAQEKLFKPMAAQTLPMRNKILAEPATLTYLQGYLMLASVAARILAGRKLRWKRDSHLSQGMRIGPASSRATSGMKLTGVDKSEAMKEDREASDLVRGWKDQVGRLRHVVSAANQARQGALGAVPDLQESMPVKTVRQSDGGVPARMPCMLCGLKRDERVGSVDLDVQDSFGEWWIEQVNMHRGCRNFWQQHRDTLRQH